MSIGRRLLISIFVIICTCARADIHVRTKFLSSDNGLGANYVRCIVQDPRGYIWMASTTGLVRYDGYHAEVLKPSEAKNRRLMLDMRIQDMRLWKDRYILLLFRSKKYSCYDIQTDEFIEFVDDYAEAFKNRADVSKLPPSVPREGELKLDNRGNLVMTTVHGDVWHVDAKTRAVTHLTGVYSDELHKLNGKPRYDVVTDRDGVIWVSTYGNGLFAHDRKTGETTHFLDKGMNNAPIQTNYLMRLFEDKNGNIWVCQENMGVACLTKQREDTETVYFSTAGQTDHTNNIRMLERIGDRIYIGNRYNGLKISDGLLNNMQVVTKINDDVVAVCADKNGTVWMGTRNNGVYAGDYNSRHDDANPASLAKGKVSDVVCDKQGRVWISFFDDCLDMAVPDGKGGYTFRHFFRGDNAVDHPRQLIVDHHGYVWMTTNDGVYVFQPDKLIANPTAYRHILVTDMSPQLNEIHCVFETHDHRVLLGTVGNGMAEYDNSKAGQPVLKHIYTTDDGLPDNNVQQLVEDKNGYVWIGTDNGLARFSPTKHTFVSFLPSSNKLGNMFVENAICLLENGKVAFGSNYGIVVVDPANLPVSQSQFLLRITDIDINGMSIHDQEDGSLYSLLEQRKEISLSYNQNSLTFHFSDFEYAEGESSKYSYRLVGYDDDWSPLLSYHMATYRNLPPGHYVMEVRAQSANGEWNKQTVRLPIVIKAPFWRTWWAYLIYLLMVGAAGLGIYRYFKRVNDLRNEILMENQLTEFKLRFFTDISHEFRTPLTIIRGAMDRIYDLGTIPGDMRQPVSSMRKSVDRMMRLINELLEFRKLQNKKLQLALEETDLIDFVRSIWQTFYEIAENKRINYTFTPFAREYKMYVDRNYIDKTVYNLLSNAFKYTMSHHSIALKITHDEEAQTVSIIVEDTGIGIPKKAQADLFSRFNQSIYTQNSIGIGLHLIHGLVTTHHGDITFRENEEGGCIFTVTLPTNKDVYDEKDFLVAGNALLKEEEERNGRQKHDDYREMAAEPLNDKKVLIVEDDDNVAEYVKGELGRYFVIMMASNGQEALDKIQNERPDLIISDVMMPIMTGYELTTKVRANQETADIPIILLTALTTDEKHVKGFDSGADAYIEKPFSTKVLLAKCRQLMEQREKLRHHYAKEVVGKAVLPEIIVGEQDQRFRNQLDNWLESHYSDFRLDINTFAESMGYGRTNFYKKVKKITGQTPNDYIKTLRMTKAADLLRDDTLTVAQISYMVGFEDPYYFSKSFKSFYGVSPSQYRKGEAST